MSSIEKNPTHRKEIPAIDGKVTIQKQKEETRPETILPVLSITNNVLFPNTYLLLVIENEALIKVIRKVYENNGTLGIVTQKKEGTVTSPNDIFEIGTTAQVVRFSSLSNQHINILICGKEKFRVDELVSTSPYLTARITKLHDETVDTNPKKTKKLVQLLKETITQLAAIHPEFPHEVKLLVDNIKDFNTLTYFLAPGLDIELADKQSLLEIHDAKKRASLLLKHLEKDIQTAQIRKKIHDKIHHEVGQVQRDFYIRRQIKALQEELGEREPEDEIDELRDRGTKKNWPENVAAHFYTSINKAERMGPTQADYACTDQPCRVAT